MKRIIDKSLLLLLGIGMIVNKSGPERPVLVLLGAVIYIAALEYVQRPELGSWWAFALVCLCLVYAEGACVIPLVWYDAEEKWRRLLRAGQRGAFSAAIPLLLVSISSVVVWVRGYLMLDGGIFFWSIGIWSGLLAVLLGRRTGQILDAERELIHLRDENVERMRSMKERQRALSVSREADVHRAILGERRRIAREIHDHVGHMLTRSILQVGALEVVCRDGAVGEQLHLINESLNEAMDDIRNSVRNLHDESFDLEQSVREAVTELEEYFAVELDYDLPSDIPREVKYCLFSVTKEAISNMNHHCDGDRVRLSYREHPAFWKLEIRDNGKHIEMGRQSGIGLVNMEERVEALGGQIHFSTENGFGIVATIPRKTL